MKKVMTLGNGLMLQIAVSGDSIKTWLNGRSGFFTALCIKAIGINLVMVAFFVLIRIVDSLENI